MQEEEEVGSTFGQRPEVSCTVKGGLPKFRIHRYGVIGHLLALDASGTFQISSKFSILAEYAGLMLQCQAPGLSSS